MRRTSIRRVHRWIGIASLLFLLLLSVTGIALNHTTGLRLDKTYLAVPWLLDWYGLEVPSPAASFALDGERVTLIGERLYLDAHELARGVPALTGAVAAAGLLMITTDRELLTFSRSADLVDRIDLAEELGAPIDGLAAEVAQMPSARDRVGPSGSNAELRAAPLDSARLVVRSTSRVYLYDAQRARVRPLDMPSEDVAWSTPSMPPEELLERIGRTYRGEGLTLERVVYDLHSGRLLGPIGAAAMDLLGIVFVVLSITGLVIWLRARG